MKILVVDKKNKNNFVEVIFSEKISQNRFIFDGKNEKLEIKIPKKKEMNRRKWIIFVRGIIQEAKKNKIKNITFKWNDLISFNDLGEGLAKLFSENVIMANYEFRKYKKKPKEGFFDVENIEIIYAKKDKNTLQKGIKEGKVIAEQVNACRDMANTPGGDMTPEILVRETKKAIKGTGIAMSVLGEKEMKRKKMNGVLSVGQGSDYESKFIILKYSGGQKNAKSTVLIGKGVTFDSGGIDTKPHPHATDMMMDMSGGAAVINTIILAAKLKIKKNIIALIPAVENMPSGSSFRPGDIVRMMDGTSVEIGHTDAEGRLILADALTYSKKFKPSMVIDVATLTGAAVVALGERANAIFTNNDRLAEKTEKIAEKVGDYIWRMPLWEEYESEIKGTHGDISNIKTKGNPGAGSITAASFLKHFIKAHKSWMHIDIAPRMTSVFDENLSKGATGTPIKVLIELLKK